MTNEAIYPKRIDLDRDLLDGRNWEYVYYESDSDMLKAWGVWLQFLLEWIKTGHGDFFNRHGVDGKDGIEYCNVATLAEYLVVDVLWGDAKYVGDFDGYVWERLKTVVSKQRVVNLNDKDKMALFLIAAAQHNDGLKVEPSDGDIVIRIKDNEY
jgi:hypothetical protein